MKPCSAIKTDLLAGDYHRKKIDTRGRSHSAPAGQPPRWPPTVPDRDDGSHPGLEAAVQPVGRADGVPAARPHELQALLRAGECNEHPRSHHGLDLPEPHRRSRREGSVRRCLGAAAQKGLHRSRWSDNRRYPGAGAQAAQQPGIEALIEQGAMPAGWKPAKLRQKDLDATWTQNTARATSATSSPSTRISIN